MISAATLAPMVPAHAAGAKEPLIITKASDGGALLLAGANMSVTPVETSESSSVDQAINNFSSAVAEALRADQQAIQTACKASKPPNPGTAAAWEWGARCSYVRR